MNEILTLLSPRFRSFVNAGGSRQKQNRLVRTALFGLIGLVFWGGMFYISLRVLSYFAGIAEIGDILAWKLLSMVMVIYFSLLVFSSILTGLSKLYLSRDLQLVFAMPVSGFKIFIARWIEAAIDSSWMIIIYTLPILIAYGIVYHAGPYYYIVMGLVMLLLSAIAAIISAAVVMIVVMIIPAGRIKSIFVFLGMTLFLLLYLAFRLLRPERLVNPEAFKTVLVYMKTMQTPASPFLPSTWAFDTFKFALTGMPAQSLLNLALMVSGAGVLIFITVILADAIYFKGVSKTQTARKPFMKARTGEKSIFAIFPRPVKAYIEKEIKTFFRDQTQWSQIFLILALVFIYVYNFKVLPLDKAPIKTVYLQNLLSFLNMGLAAFVLTAITGRFAFTAVSIEGEAFWLVRSTPMKIRTFLWIKFFIYLIPLLILTEILIVATNIMLKVTPFMMGLSVVTILFMVPAVVAMGIGLGAAYPDFSSENPTQAITSFGGLIFMMLCAGYIGAVIVLEAGPVYKIFMAGMFGHAMPVATWALNIGAFMLAIGLSIAAIILPMRFGEKQLSEG